MLIIWKLRKLKNEYIIDEKYKSIWSLIWLIILYRKAKILNWETFLKTKREIFLFFGFLKKIKGLKKLEMCLFE